METVKEETIYLFEVEIVDRNNEKTLYTAPRRAYSEKEARTAIVLDLIKLNDKVLKLNLICEFTIEQWDAYFKKYGTVFK